MNRNWIAVAVLAFAGAGQASAQGDDDKQDGAFVGVGIGDYSSDGDISNVNFDESESVYKLFGGWRWNQFFAIQADYYDLGRVDSSSGGTNLQIETSGYVARIEGTLPLAFFELFATAGLFYSDVDTSTQTGAVRTEANDSDTNPVYSVGFGFEIAERFVVRLEYEIIDIAETSNLDADSDAIWLTAAWRF